MKRPTSLQQFDAHDSHNIQLPAISGDTRSSAKRRLLMRPDVRVQNRSLGELPSWTNTSRHRLPNCYACYAMLPTRSTMELMARELATESHMFKMAIPRDYSHLIKIKNKKKGLDFPSLHFRFFLRPRKTFS